MNTEETTTQNMKTPTLQEIKDQIAQKYRYLDWADLSQHEEPGTVSESIANEVAKAYAKQLIEADRKDCAAKIKLEVVRESAIGPIYDIDRASILNRPLPPMP